MNRPSIFNRYLLIPLAVASALSAAAERVQTTLKDGWEFRKEANGNWTEWQKVRIPHDWAIHGPFSRDNDLQKVAVKQNGEEIATWKTGRTGGLPFIGKGQYRTTFELPDTAERSVSLLFDGAMSNAVVRVNGREVTRWPHGYNSFHVGIDSVMRPGANTIEVDLENLPLSSRWYPGAGLYRNVHVINTSRIHIPVWGTQIITPHVGDDFASVEVTTTIDGAPTGQELSIVTRIISPDGLTVASDSSRYRARGQKIRQGMTIEHPDLWSPSNPALYTARTEILYKGEVQDTHDTRFGIRSLEYVPEKGFYLNGELTKFRGVCNHHDLGPLGAAVNRSALRHQLGLLKDMGVNAIRTSHNMPAPELVELCDKMGLMLMVEPFDDWSHWPKSPNGYGRVFKEWAERDIINMVEHYRNNPSVVMWSSGNEVPSQTADGGLDELLMIQDLIHRLDPTRPVTNGMDRVPNTLNNGFAAATDIPGFNYKPQRYIQARKTLPQGLILGTETASTVSSRGVYHFPVTWKEHNVVMHPDKQSSSYDNETCAWSNTPDLDLAADEDFPWLLGQFVWTGFD
ncbi:MAG: beta-galactosidase, partial [Duncaniella sp.]|nr:beta-galactosidase [Duncaniella sp.]